MAKTKRKGKKSGYSKMITIRGKSARNPRKKGTSMRLLRCIGGFPDEVVVKLRYVEEIRLNPSTAGIDQHLIRAISVYDPSQSTIGHQPMYYDQWTAIYSKYTVLGSKCTMQFCPASNTTQNNLNGYYGIYVSTNTAGVSSFTSIEPLLESANSTSMRFGGLLSNAPNANDKSNKTSINFSSRKFFGIKDPEDGNAYSAEVSTNPAQEAYFCCYYGSMGSNDPTTQQFLITTDYIVKFKDRKPVDQS